MGLCSVVVFFFHVWLDRLKRTSVTRAQAITELNKNQVKSSCGMLVFDLLNLSILWHVGSLVAACET